MIYIVNRNADHPQVIFLLHGGDIRKLCNDETLHMVLSEDVIDQAARSHGFASGAEYMANGLHFVAGVVQGARNDADLAAYARETNPAVDDAVWSDTPDQR